MGVSSDVVADLDRNTKKKRRLPTWCVTRTSSGFFGLFFHALVRPVRARQSQETWVFVAGGAQSNRIGQQRNDESYSVYHGFAHSSSLTPRYDIIPALDQRCFFFVVCAQLHIACDLRLLCLRSLAALLTITDMHYLRSLTSIACDH